MSSKRPSGQRRRSGQREFTTDKATDFAAILTTLKATNPDVVFYGGADAQSAPMAKQMKRLGLKAPLVSGEMTKTPTFLKLAGKRSRRQHRLAGWPAAGPDAQGKD